MLDCTQDVIEEAASAARRGLPLRYVADLIGMGQSTIESWLQKGEEGLEPYVRFSSAIRRARAEFVDESLARSRGEGKNPGGSQWALERLFPEFRQSSVVESTVRTDAVVRVEGLEGMTLEQLRALARPTEP